MSIVLDRKLRFKLTVWRGVEVGEPTRSLGYPGGPEARRWSVWEVYRRHLGVKLGLWLTVAMLVAFGVLGYATIRLHRHHLEVATLGAAERVSDTVKRSTEYHMLRNDRDAMYQIIRTLGAEPGIVRIRILNPVGRISYSSDPSEIDHNVDKSTEACYACHAKAQPLARLNRPDRFRIYGAKDARVLGVIDPIENQPACSNAACHAHPDSQQILGVLDINMSLKATDAALRETTRQMVNYTVVAVVAICLVSGVFVWRVVHGPIKALRGGTERLTQGELGLQLPVQSDDEVGELAQSFNSMSARLRDTQCERDRAQSELIRRLEKERELIRAKHQVESQLAEYEKFAALAQLALGTTHEINNPLMGILSHLELELKEATRAEQAMEIRQCIDAAKRISSITRGLIDYARPGRPRLIRLNVAHLVNDTFAFLCHQPLFRHIRLEQQIPADLPAITADPNQISQVMMNLLLNSAQAMPPEGGLVSVCAEEVKSAEKIAIQVKDTGVGIPADILPRVFEPFFTTKRGQGTGLGLSISQAYVRNHSGEITAFSAPGQGTTIRIVLPIRQGDEKAEQAEDVIS